MSLKSGILVIDLEEGSVNGCMGKEHHYGCYWVLGSSSSLLRDVSPMSRVLLIVSFASSVTCCDH